MHEHFLDTVPVWAFFVVVLLIAVLPIEVGQRLGSRRRLRTEREAEGPVGNVVAATLALLGFMVALTVSSATERFDARKEALINGVNAIETAYRNATLLPEPHRSESQKLLVSYVEVRLEMHQLYNDPDRLRDLDTQVRSLQESLWSHAQALAEQDRSSETYAAFAASLNSVNANHNRRVILGAQYRIPLLVWSVLLTVTIITMLGVGFLFGLAGSRSLIANFMLALTFAMVMTLIFDLEQPGKGLVGVSQEPMYDLVERLNRRQ